MTSDWKTSQKTDDNPVFRVVSPKDVAAGRVKRIPDVLLQAYKALAVEKINDKNIRQAALDALARDDENTFTAIFSDWFAWQPLTVEKKGNVPLLSG
jgi:hypothetical protein